MKAILALPVKPDYLCICKIISMILEEDDMLSTWSIIELRKLVSRKPTGKIKIKWLRMFIDFMIIHLRKISWNVQIGNVSSYLYVYILLKYEKNNPFG